MRRLRVYLIGLIPLSILAQLAASAMPEQVESVYSRAIYPLLAGAISSLTGWFPFSLAELLGVVAIVALAWIFLRALTLLVRRQRKLRTVLINGLLNGLAVAGLCYGLALFLWAFNYQRVPFAASSGLDTSPASVSELRSLCEELVTRANALREEVEEDGQGVMRLQGSRWDALRRAHLGFKGVGRRYEVLRGRRAGRPKGLMLSPALTALGVPGFYFPYTAEPNVNLDIPQHTLPYNACHELAHQIGFAGEGEASFIGYFACSLHPDADFRYSAAMRALLHAMRALAREDRDAFDDLYSACSEGVKRDWKAARAFWKRHETPARKAALTALDSHLKSQGHAAGVKSYGKIVDLLIADQRARTVDTEPDEQ